jgi:hypothetical protein
LITSAKNGFRVNKSTYTAIQSFIEEILNALDLKHLDVGLFLDLSKAFDVINLDRLLAKLELYGFRGKIHEWMTSYPIDRFQYVEIYYQDYVSSSKSFTSNLNEIKRSIPQSSVLGPLLFLLFINDLPDALPSANVALFADTNIFLIDNSVEALNVKIKKVIYQLDSWFNDNQLLINTDKMKALFFHGKGLVSKYTPAICVCNREVLHSSTAKFLGIEISENLSWKNHIQHLCPKLNKAVYLIKSLRNSVSLWVLKNIYFTKFESILKYGIFWGGGCKEVEAVFKIKKKKGLRVIMGVNSQVSCIKLFCDLEILTLTSLFILQILCFIIKKWNLFNSPL